MAVAACAVPAALCAAIAEAADVITKADALLICTGAGMGVDSGLGTFRGTNAGIWKPLRPLGKDFSELSTPRWFKSDPRLAWAFWHFRHQGYTLSEPHEGYRLLAKWGREKTHGYFSVTSNIDGHWVRSIGEELVYEVHGTLTHMQHLEDDGTPPWPANGEMLSKLDVPEYDIVAGEKVEGRVGPKESDAWKPAFVQEDGSLVDEAGEPFAAWGVRRPGGEDLCRVREGSPLPESPRGGAVRPAVLMFGDWGVNKQRIDAQEVRFDQWLDSIPTDAKVAVVEIGAGTAVPTIRRTGEITMRQFPNATFIRINLEDATVRQGFKSISIAGLGAKAALEAIEAQFPA